MDSSTSVSPRTTCPSPANACPTATRTWSPNRKADKGTRSTLPASRSASTARSTASGRRALSDSSDCVTFSRARLSSQRPVSKKLTNMVSESKYTSGPSQPACPKVTPVLTPNMAAMPSATGASIEMRPCLSAAQAPLKKGPQENSITGRLSTQADQFISCQMSGEISSVPPTYWAVETIITCIMQNQATSRRQSSLR